MKTEPNMASPTVIGIDIGKEVFHLVGLSADGKIALRRKVKRLGLKDALEKLSPCIVCMEACLSAHFVSRTLRGLGHKPRIIPAIYTKPFVKGQKNDYNDAEAIAEAALRPNLRVVPEKSQDQLNLQACHRVRSRLVSRRTATINQIRAFLIEQGIVVRAGRAYRGRDRGDRGTQPHRAQVSAPDERARGWPTHFNRPGRGSRQRRGV
jgi:transposase